MYEAKYQFSTWREIVKLQEPFESIYVTRNLGGIDFVDHKFNFNSINNGMVETENVKFQLNYFNINTACEEIFHGIKLISIYSNVNNDDENVDNVGTHGINCEYKINENNVRVIDYQSMTVLDTPLKTFVDKLHNNFKKFIDHPNKKFPKRSISLFEKNTLQKKFENLVSNDTIDATAIIAALKIARVR